MMPKLPCRTMDPPAAMIHDAAPGRPAPHPPIFQSVLGDDWPRLGAVIRRHYFLRPHSLDAITVQGHMTTVHHSTLAKLLIPVGRVFGAIVPWRGRQVPIAVHYTCRPDAPSLHWDRVFTFPGRRAPFHFRSHMVQTGDREVIEFVRFGVGMRLAVTAEGGALVFRDRGYVWRLFGWHVPVPLGLVFGSAYVEERPLDDTRFTMKMRLAHRWWGELFYYEGEFSLSPAA